MIKNALLSIGSVLLTLTIVWPLFNSPAQAKFGLLTFNEILKPEISREKVPDNFEEATNRVQEKIDSLNLDYDVDVEEVVNGQFDSLTGQEGMSALQVVNLSATISSAHDTVFQNLNTATRKATETAYFNQIQNSSFGDSLMDIKTELNNIQKVVNDINQATDNIKKLYQGVDIVMGAKPAFMPEKYDYPQDSFVICNDYLPGGQLPIFPKLTDGIQFDLALPEFLNENIFDQIKGTVNFDQFVDRQFQGISNPDFAKVFQTGELDALITPNMSAAELAAKTSLALEEAEEVRNLNVAAEVYEREAQALEHMKLKISEQMNNFVQTEKILQKIYLAQQLIERIDSFKPPTT